MGRVSRYKKVKACDKQYTGGEYVWGTNISTKTKKRSLTAERHHSRKLKRKGYSDDGGHDLPPEKDDFDLSDLVVKKEKKKRLDEGLVPVKYPTVVPSSSTTTQTSSDPKPQAIVKNEKVKIGNTIVQCNIPQNDREEKRAAKLLHIDPKTGQSTSKMNSKQLSIEGRKQGESMAAFHRRLKEETVNALAENYKKSKQPQNEDQQEKSQRKKEYAKLRKLKKKGKLVGKLGSSSARDDDDFDLSRDKYKDNDDDDDGFITGEQAAAQISFLEQVEEPPIFHQLPRGASNKSKLRMASTTTTTKSNNKGKGSSAMDESRIKAEQNAMEIMRRKVQAQYALMKAKRKQEGSSFHL